MREALKRLLRDPFGTAARAWHKLVVAPRRYARGGDYDAARYWDDRFRRHGPSLASVGHEGLSEAEIGAAYAAQAEDVFGMLERAGVALAQARLLEVGCGNGYYAERLRERGLRHYQGLDITDAFFPLLRERFPGYAYAKGDISADRLEGEFDAVLMIDVIEHIVTEGKLASALTHVAAMMARGAVLVLAPVAPSGRRSLFYVRFWTEAEVMRGLPGFRVAERRGRALLLRKA
ncbi:MAG: class I SAM-dependent methyltransferase [Rhodocyclaceae bacterium]|jgi:2-polyprenyl-3-methyl-5-hydroxy-6-metoxy-1,4-benzoquinol methylase|nr:class I SAM-dependent methyltransferase [Rhodocyclaceae bacterium]